MRTTMRAMRWMCAAVVLAPLAFAGSDPCVPEDGSVDVNFPNPDISGFGAGAHIEGAVAYEADPGSNDTIGRSDAKSGSVTVSVSNDGDNLSAGGEVGDGSAGEDCFEIFVEWKIVYYTSVTYTVDVGVGPLSVSKSHTKIVESTATIRSAVNDVCPC